MAETSSEIIEARFWEHIDRPARAAIGVRRVEWLRLASNRDAPPGWAEVVVYRPLDTEAHVYRVGQWDYRPHDEFLRRYRPIFDADLTACLAALTTKIYDPTTWTITRITSQ